MRLSGLALSVGFVVMQQGAWASADLVELCTDALQSESDAPIHTVVCRYRDVPMEEPPLETDPGFPGHKRVLEDGVICVGERKQGEAFFPLLIQLERISSEYIDAYGVLQRTEYIFPQYVYKFNKIKNTSRKLTLHEKAKLISRDAERDTYFKLDKHQMSARIREKYYYGGRLFSMPYAVKERALGCAEYP